MMHLAGSAADGYGFFPALAADIGFDCTQIFSQDVDLNLVYVNYTVRPQQLEPTGAPGYVRLVVKDRDPRWVQDEFIAKCAVQASQEGRSGVRRFLSANIALKCLSANLPLQPRSRNGHPTVTFSVPLKCRRGDYHLDIDMAFAFPLRPWPPEAREWVTRPRTGVSPLLVEEIVQEGALLVAKACPHRACQHEFDWRITFTQAEVKLFHHHAQDKKSLKLCYIILKFIIKTIHLDHEALALGPEVRLAALKSYYLKTLYLWIAENPPEFCVAKPDMNRIFVFLIKQFTEALRLGMLRNYFLPRINLLADCDRAAMRQGIRALRVIRRKRNFYVHRFQMLWFDKFCQNRWRGVQNKNERRSLWRCIMQLLTLG